MSDRLRTRLGPLTLDNPFINASGTFGYAVEYAGFVDVARLGGVSVKGISLDPRPGNAPPRTVETAAGMLNSIGLANIGIDAFIGETMPRLRELGVTVIVNTFATSVEDFVDNLASAPDDHGSSAHGPALVERLRARRERLLRKHGLYDTTPLIREFREAGR